MDEVTIKKAHRYALFNCEDDEVEKYISEHQNFMDSMRGTKWVRVQNHCNDFMSWFENKVVIEDSPDDHIVWLAKGPNPVATEYSGYVVNGYRFHTRARDQLTIGKRTSLRQKQVYGPQNPLDDEAHAEQHRIEVEGVYERQAEELAVALTASKGRPVQTDNETVKRTIGRRSSPRKKQVHGPQNPLDGEAHTEEQPIEVEGVYERQAEELAVALTASKGRPVQTDNETVKRTIGRRSSPRKKQVHGPQNPLDGEAHTEEHPIEVEGVYERQQLIIGRRSSPRKKQVHGPQNPLDGEAHTEEAAEIAERRVHERGRSQYHNQNQLIGELLQEDQTLEGRQSKEQMTRELIRTKKSSLQKSKVLS
ncbi:hypothetical protein Dimus_026940 [Dionaea muscipula]